MAANTQDLKPKVRSMMDAFLKEAKKQGIGLLVTQGVRTIVEQNELYKKGRRGVKGEKVVTNAKGGESLHNFGCAFDVAFLLPNGAVTWIGDWNKIGKIGKSLGLEWGGDWWRFKDRPHFQYTAGYSLKDFRLGSIDNEKFGLPNPTTVSYTATLKTNPKPMIGYQLKGSPEVYVQLGHKYVWVNSWEAFTSLGGSKETIIQLDPSEYAKLSISNKAKLTDY